MAIGRVRRLNRKNTFDPNHIDSILYNEKAGAEKNLNVGPSLMPIRLDGTTWSLDATTARRVGGGAQLAIYNNSGTLYTIRFGAESTVTSGGVGSIDANGVATIPCMPNTWTYVCSGALDWAITNNAALLVYIIEDDTIISG